MLSVDRDRQMLCGVSQSLAVWLARWGLAHTPQSKTPHPDNSVKVIFGLSSFLAVYANPPSIGLEFGAREIGMPERFAALTSATLSFANQISARPTQRRVPSCAAAQFQNRAAYSVLVCAPHAGFGHFPKPDCSGAQSGQRPAGPHAATDRSGAAARDRFLPNRLRQISYFGVGNRRSSKSQHSAHGFGSACHRQRLWPEDFERCI